MEEITGFDPMERLRDFVESFSEKRGIDVTEIDGGFVLDIPIEYEILEGSGENIIEDFDEFCRSKKQDNPNIIIESIIERRGQYVYVTADHRGPLQEYIYQVFTICGPEDERFYRSALMINMNLPFGAFAISQIEGKSSYVLVDTYLAEKVSDEELEQSIISVARAGDRTEKLLVGEDIA